MSENQTRTSSLDDGNVYIFISKTVKLNAKISTKPKGTHRTNRSWSELEVSRSHLSLLASVGEMTIGGYQDRSTPPFRLHVIIFLRSNGYRMAN